MPSDNATPGLTPEKTAQSKALSDQANKLAQSLFGMTSSIKGADSTNGPDAQESFLTTGTTTDVSDRSSSSYSFGKATPSILDGTSELAGNKKVINDALTAAGASDAERAGVLAMAMQETPDIEAAERDTSKDGQPASKNYSAFNLNPTAIAAAGYTGNLDALNDQANLGSTAVTVLHGIRSNVLDFWDSVRGGTNALNDHVSYDASGYRTAILSTALELQNHPNEMSSSDRVAVDLKAQ